MTLRFIFETNDKLLLGMPLPGLGCGAIVGRPSIRYSDTLILFSADFSVYIAGNLSRRIQGNGSKHTNLTACRVPTSSQTADKHITLASNV